MSVRQSYTGAHLSSLLDKAIFTVDYLPRTIPARVIAAILNKVHLEQEEANGSKS
jgi:hypothetical protein